MRNRFSTTIVFLAALSNPFVALGQTGPTAAITKFDKPIEIVMSQDVRDPDRYIDEFIAKTSDPAEQARLRTIKTLDHAMKVKWLLGLSTVPEGTQIVPASAAVGAAICVVVTVTFIIYVVVGTWIDEKGKEHKEIEAREVERQIRECK